MKNKTIRIIGFIRYALSRNYRKLLIASALIAASTAFHQTHAQQTGIKTNILFDVTASPNLGIEFQLGNHTSLDVPVNWNPFTFANNRKWKHLIIQPELRFWTKDPFSGHFFGLHAHYGLFNVGNLPEPFSQYMRDHRFEGWLAGAGVSYGHRWNFSQRWGMEATIGAGYAYLDYDKFKYIFGGEKIADETKHYYGPTKIGLSLIYTMGKKKHIPKAKILPHRQYTAPYTPQYVVSYVIPEVEDVKMRSDEGKIYLDFESGKTQIIPTFRRNSEELEKLRKLIEAIINDPNATITCFTIKGFASPEGLYSNNLTLSEKRVQSLKDYILSLYDFPESIFSITGMGEDWATLDSLVSKSDMPGKYEILKIIRDTDIFEGREKKLMDLSGGNPYRMMSANLFPQLRRAEYQLHYTVPSFTIDKSKEIFKTKPSSLSLNEMFMIANTYEPGSDQFNEIFETAAYMFPLDDTAKMNAAASALNRGDTILAGRYLSQIKEQSPAWYNNMGVLHGLNGDWEKAKEAFEKAQSFDKSKLNPVEIAKENNVETEKAFKSRILTNDIN